MPRKRNHTIELEKLSANLNSLSENLLKAFSRFQMKQKKKANANFHSVEWEYSVEAGTVLWHLFEDHYKLLDKKLQNIIGHWKGDQIASYNSDYAKGITFKSVCKHWIDNFDDSSKSTPSHKTYAMAMKQIAEYIKQLNT